MPVVILLTDRGTPVEISNDFTNIKFTPAGFLREFNFGGFKYKFYSKEEFRNYDNSSLFNPLVKDSYHFAQDGYYREDIYLDYIQFIGGSSLSLSEIIKTYKFNFGKYIASVGNDVQVKILEPTPPYTYYFQQNEYYFELEENPDFGTVKHYKKDYSTEINIPSTAVSIDVSKNREGTPLWYFYRENFGSWVESSAMSDGEKRKIAYTLTISTFYINAIVNEIFPQDTTFLNKMENVANDLSDYEDLSLADKLLFTLLKSWGYFHDPNSLLEHRKEFAPIFSSTSVYSEFEGYYEGLFHYYTISYKTKDITPDWDNYKKIENLIRLLPLEAIEIIPYSIRLSVVKDKMKGEMKQDDENLVIKVVSSFKNEADDFLGFLLESENYVKTNYEIIHYLMDDARLSRYIPGLWFFYVEFSNRKFFTYALYNLWKISKYNTYYIPSGVTPTEKDLNPNAFFLQESHKHYSDQITVLFFNPNWQGDGLGQYKVTFTSEIKGVDIEITKVETVILQEAGTERYYKYGLYHIYQPISVIGYTPALEYQNKYDMGFLYPETGAIPAFLFYYFQEYEEIKDFDAGLNFIRDITLEAIFFYYTGGFSAFKYLRHLKYLTKIGAALRGELAATEAVLLFRGVAIGGEVFSMTAGVCAAVNNYVVNTTNNQETYELANALGLLFVFLSLGSSASSAIASDKAFEQAGRVLDEINILTANNIPHNLTQEVIDSITHLRTNDNVRITLFKNELSTLDFDGIPNHVNTIFNTFSIEEQKQFFVHFANKINDVEFWKNLNVDLGKKVEIWGDTDLLAAGSAQHKTYRSSSIYLDELYKLIYSDDKAFDHLEFFKNRPSPMSPSSKINHTGGHLEILELNGSAPYWVSFNGVKILDPNFPHIIDPTSTSQKMINYLNGIGKKIYSKAPVGIPSSGHINHHYILQEIGPIPTNPAKMADHQEFILNGVLYELKKVHTQFNWSVDEALVEMAFMLSRKVKKRRPSIEPNGLYGVSIRHIRTHFTSTFSDGSKVEIIHVNYHQYNQGPIFYDHYEYFELKK